MNKSSYAFVSLAALVLLLAGANLLFTAREVNQVRGTVLASCGFAADLGGAPLSVNPKTGQASRLGVQIVSDSRVQWHGLGCPGVLPPPAPTFMKWARYYHLPVN